MSKNIVLLLALAVCCIPGRLAAESQSNFQIAPPPIAYPYFEAGRSDGRVEPTFITISSDAADLSLAGIGISAVGRQALSDWVAFDVQGGMFVLTGQMAGIPPITPIPTGDGYYYYTRVDGNADVSMVSFIMSFNLELQLLKADEGSLIFFFGPNFGVSSMTIQTPYSLIVPPPYSNAGSVYSGYTDTLTVSSSTGGAQFGMQAGLNLGHGVHFTPFFMMSSTSGTATMTDNPGYSSAGTTSMTADIPESSVTSFGMDIVIDDMSIGTMLQNIQSQDEEESSEVDIFMLRFGFNF